MTLDEAKEVANLVLANKTRSHVQAARELAQFVLGIEEGAARTDADGWAPMTTPDVLTCHAEPIALDEPGDIEITEPPTAVLPPVTIYLCDLPADEPPGSHDGDEPSAPDLDGDPGGAW